MSLGNGEAVHGPLEQIQGGEHRGRFRRVQTRLVEGMQRRWVHSSKQKAAQTVASRVFFKTQHLV